MGPSWSRPIGPAENPLSDPAAGAAMCPPTPSPPCHVQPWRRGGALEASRRLRRVPRGPQEGNKNNRHLRWSIIMRTMEDVVCHVVPASSWRRSIVILASSWRRPGVVLASSWRRLGVVLTSSWRRPGAVLASPWRRPGAVLASPRRRPDDVLASSWHRPGVVLASPRRRPGAVLASSWRCPGVVLASS